MFFFIGGLQPKTINLGKKNMPCPECGSFDMHLKRVDNYISLFFIPVFPIKKGDPFLICNKCNSVFDEGGLRRDTANIENRKKCIYCGKYLKKDFRFCPYCGKTISKV